MEENFDPEFESRVKNNAIFRLDSVTNESDEQNPFNVKAKY